MASRTFLQVSSCRIGRRNPALGGGLAATVAHRVQGESMLLLEGSPHSCTAALPLTGQHSLSLSPLVAAKSDSQAAQPGSGRSEVGNFPLLPIHLLFKRWSVCLWVASMPGSSVGNCDSVVGNAVRNSCCGWLLSVWIVQDKVLFQQLHKNPQWLGVKLFNMFKNFPKKWQLCVALILILWESHSSTQNLCTAESTWDWLEWWFWSWSVLSLWAVLNDRFAVPQSLEIWLTPGESWKQWNPM